MIAGTIAVFGECGIRPGAGMRRGTLALFGANPPALLPSFDTPPRSSRSHCSHAEDAEGKGFRV